MNEQEFHQRLRERTENTPVPDSLSPDAIPVLINDAAKKEHKSTHTAIFRIKIIAPIAACFLLFGLVLSFVRTGVLSNNNQIASDKSADSLAETQPDSSYETETETATALPDGISSPKDYQQLYSVLSELTPIYTCVDEATINGFEDNVKTIDGNSRDTETTRSPSYSDTNSQVAEVAEADIVKTDGVYIYSAYKEQNYYNAIAIAKAESGSLTACSTIRAEQIQNAIGDNAHYCISELYIEGTQLIILGMVEYTDTQNKLRYAESSATGIFIYDVSDPTAPMLSSFLTQDGYYSDSRLTNGCLYTFSSSWKDIPSVSNQYDAYVPNINGTLLSCEDIYLPECPDASCYQIMTGLRLDNPDSFVSEKAILSGYGTYYVSTDNLYLAQYNYNSMDSTTELLKFHYENGTITPVGSVDFSGYLLNQFSMDEYNGYLRVVATIAASEHNYNALYIIDESMQLVGEISNLAPDEQIYSARFMGDTGYFVTYRNTDPLFSVDLSDPENPVIMGALKIPGFSNYLHFYSENYLFGLGEETNPETSESLGVKLSMFDISDPYHVTEADKTILTDADYLTAQFNHKSLLIDAEKNLIGFYFETYDAADGTCDETYVIYSYHAGSGFRQEASYNLRELLSDSDTAYDTRGLYIDDVLYLVNGNAISSYSLDTYEPLDSIQITNKTAP